MSRETPTEEERERRDEGAPDAAEAAGTEPADEGNAEGEGTRDGSEEGAAEQVAHDLDELTATKRERDEYLELAQRTRADFENYRKRVAAQADEALRRGKAELAREIVPVLDNLDRALNAAEGDEALAKGVALVRDELRAILERAGVEAYDPAGERFDPSWHEAISTRTEEGTPAGTVLETLDRGYRLDGQVLRAARVVVSE